ncbi:MAG: L-fucose:H+ symporter permease [Bacteroidetes bacterium]|nr:MAG: L-fucose:H+ symporter permease [Bacteroidota bacterium]
MEKRKFKVLEKQYLVPFILITSCFAFWGLANDITNPMVKAFSKIFLMNTVQGSLVQVAFYGGYFAMAFPAAIFIRRFTYKAGILVGLGLYATGALLFIPASAIGLYAPFLIAYFILTCGLSFLETSANPYILSMGAEESSTQRLNLAQSFNPIGSITGMFIAKTFIQARLDPADTAQRQLMSPGEFEAVKMSDLEILSSPYIIIGIVIIMMFILIAAVRMPKNADSNKTIDFFPTLKRIFSLPRYREGVVAQFFYVGAQIMCWTFIVHYGTRYFMSQGMGEQEAEVLSQQYNIVAMAIFIASRFISTFLMRYVRPGRLLMFFAIGGFVSIAGVILSQGIMGMYCLVATSAFMSLMFPTIYGIALRGLGEDAKFGAAGLIMAILGGSVMPPMQGAIIKQGTIMSMPAENISFIIPLICFVVVAIYGFRTRTFAH